MPAVPATVSPVAIIGATGPAGRHLARDLLDRGIAVRVIARRGDVLERLFPDRTPDRSGGASPALTRFATDARNADALRRSVEGCPVIVDCIGLPARDMAEHPRTARSLAGVLAATGAHCVQVSSYWAYLPVRTLPLDEAHPREGGNPMIVARREAEDILRDAGAAVAHLPDFFGPHVQGTLQAALADAAAGRAIRWIGGAAVAREYLHIADAMRLVAELALRPDAAGWRWMLPGAGPLTGQDVAAIAGRHLGRPVRLQAAPGWLLHLAAPFVRPLREILPMVPHYARPIAYDATRLSALLGGPPAVMPYDRAIPATLDWLRDLPGKRTPP